MVFFFFQTQSVVGRLDSIHAFSLPHINRTGSYVNRYRFTAFIAEHDLSFTVALPLVELSKKLVEDKNALANLSFSNNHASYFLQLHTGPGPRVEATADREAKKGHPFPLNANV